ncbi:MAG: hypothetical protein Q4A03_00150 [Rothia sp. (in: high G+C Gram-positive bacteria)]|uniref:hypothetical protein n=1 Tax=Rothia sp. (in: high G+C Gram-positive bacteria) TaxID=1885016 RepID=UPI0026FF282A|nr:hypothetical protein [Rothia sp. (in: high G+C Gram-positive bacteria)]
MTHLEELNQKLLTCQQLTARYPNRYQLEAAIARGRYRRVTRGFYLHRSDWDKLTPEETYLARVLALAASYPGIIFSHQTAALLHGLPLENLPETVHVYCYHRTRAKDYTVHHGELHLPIDTTVLAPGIRMTSLERTLTDLAEKPSPQRHRIKL